MKPPGLKKASADFRSPGFFFFTLLAIAAHSAIAQPAAVVRSISVTGAAVFSKGEILERFRTSPGKPFDASLLRQDLDGLRDRYRHAGYLSCTATAGIDTVDESGRNIRIMVREGKQVVIGSIGIVDSIPGRSGMLSERLGIGIGSVFDQTALEEGIHRILKALENEGHPLASVAVGSVSIDTAASVDSAHILLSVLEGPQVQVSEVRIEGNRTTRDEVILREVGLNEHAFYSDERGQEIRRRLERLQLFSSVALPEFYVTRKGIGGILVKVQEGRQNRFDGIVGYVPSGAGGEAGYVTGLVDLQFRNLFGTGRSFATRWVRETQATQELALRYREPWVGSWPVNLEVGFGQRKQDSTYLRRSYDGSVEVMLNDMLTAGFVVNQVSVYPGETSRNAVSASSNTTVGVTMKYDTRNDPVTPQSGALYSTTIETGRKSVSGGVQRGNSSTRRVTFDLESYFSLAREQVLALLLHGRDVESPLLDQSDLFRLGGAMTLRGYREAQFLGSRMVWLNTEYRFLLGGRSYAYGFFDLGYTSTPDRSEAGLTKSELTRTGYGVGARVDTRVGMIGVSLGFGEGDTFRTAKLHLRLVNEF